MCCLINRTGILRSTTDMFKPKYPINYAIEKAREMPITKSPSGKTQQRIYALCLDAKGRILSESPNQYTKSHPYQYECSCEVGNEEAIYLHAEISAIVKCKNKKKIHKLVVARVGNTGKPLLAKPCPICEIAIANCSIKSIEYTT